MKSFIIALIVVLLVGMGWVYAGTKKPEKVETTTAVALDKETSGKAAIGGEFTLTNQKGEKVSDKDFRGKYMLVYFGFTNCPAICPTEMTVMTQALNALGADAAKFQPILITIDPERDTPQQMAEFLKNFHPSFIGLTGTQDEVDKVKNEYKVFSSRVDLPDDKGNYNIDHSSFIYLMDKEGKYMSHFPSGGTSEDLAAGLKNVK